VQSLSHSESLMVEACTVLSLLVSLHTDALSLVAASNVINSTKVACKGLHSDSEAVKSAASRLERSLFPRGGAFQLEGQAPDTRESLTRRLLSKTVKGDRRPISATLAVSRGSGTGSRPSTAASGARSGKAAGCRRPASASFAMHKAQMTGGVIGFGGAGGDTQTDDVRGSLMIQHQILTLKKEAESLRRENLAIMAGAVAEMDSKPELEGVSVDATICAWNAKSAVAKDLLSNQPAASGGKKLARAGSAKRMRTSSPYLQTVKLR